MTTKHTCQHLIKSTGLLCHRKAEVYNYKSTMLAWDQIEEKWNQHGSSLNLGPFADEVEWGGDGRSGWEATSRLGGETHLQVLVVKWNLMVVHSYICLVGGCLLTVLSLSALSERWLSYRPPKGGGTFAIQQGFKVKQACCTKVKKCANCESSIEVLHQPMVLSH